MANSIDRYFHFLNSPRDIRSSGKLWYPAADVYKTPEGWLVKVELAGVSAEDIIIEINGRNLYIAGCRKDRTCTFGVTYQQMEITYSQFEKSLDFPSSIEKARLEHNFEDGLLMIFLTTS
ncbi:MAG: Hsp20/alpha crystallin family protein [Pyrinomonadaceae bacterium]